MPIPKIIHQMWLDADPNNADSTEIPKKYNRYVATIKEKNPDFKYVFWNYNKCLTLFDEPDLEKYKDFWLGDDKKI
jgi:mannosyltransferase OCH1-like enzyme